MYLIIMKDFDGSKKEKIHHFTLPPTLPETI